MTPEQIAALPEVLKAEIVVYGTSGRTCWYEKVDAVRKSNYDALAVELEKAKANEATCHCGLLMSEHTQFDNHSAVEMRQPCPNTTRAAEADRLLREARDELKEIRDWALVEKAVLREQELESIGEVIDQLEGRG
jgi:hypothetical protein